MALKLAILTKNPSLYSVKRFKMAVAQQKHNLTLVDPAYCAMVTAGGKSYVVDFNNRPLDYFDFVIPRFGSTVGDYSISLVRHFEFSGMRVINGYQAIENTRNKFNSLQRLAEEGIAVPPSILLKNTFEAPSAVERLGGLPVVIKFIRGTQGLGVILAESMHALRSIVDAFNVLGYDLYLQRYIRKERGNDLRLFVIGDKVVASMRRVAKRGEFRSNIHQGGDALTAPALPEVEEMAVRSCRVLGLDYGGVDIIETDEGNQVLEVNCSPGFEGMEKASGKDIAGTIIAWVASLAGAARKKKGGP
jgi:ribosomal protein S6--L-glutamate ligase